MSTTNSSLVFKSALAINVLLASVSASAEMKVVSEGKATQILTDEFVVRSTLIDREFMIEVTRAVGVAPGQKTAVIYATDGGFGLVGPGTRVLAADGKIPKVHVVSIGYPNERGRHMGPRERDLSHGHIVIEGRAVDGVGEAFETFILTELRPFIEARYPVDSERSILFGHSMGGLFVANVLVRKPESFAGYLIGGLPIVGDPSLIEKAKAVAPRGNGRRVFIGYAPDDIRRLRANEFTAPISGPNSTFKVLEQNFVDEKHNSEILMLIAKGFRFLLPTDGSDRAAIALKNEVFDRYVGEYRLPGAASVVIAREGNHLFATLVRGERRDRVEIFAESENRFFARDAFAQFTLSDIVDGKAQKLVFRLNESDSMATRMP